MINEMKTIAKTGEIVLDFSLVFTVVSVLALSEPMVREFRYYFWAKIVIKCENELLLQI